MLEINKIHQGDCLEVMKHIDDKSVDMVLCDLPYGVTARNKWDTIISFDKLWIQYKRIIKDNGAIVLTATEPFSSMLIMSNKEMFRYDLIWQKSQGTGFLNANRMPLRNHEQILVFYKNLPTYNPQKTKGKPYSMTRRNDTSNYNEVKNLKWTTNNENGDRFPVSVLKFNYDKEKLHPTQKPVSLGRYLIKSFTNKNNLVLDNTCGSGSFILASKLEGRNFIGIEKEAKYIEIANKRLSQETLIFNEGV